MSYTTDELIDKIRELQQTAVEPKPLDKPLSCAYSDHDTISIRDDEDEEYVVLVVNRRCENCEETEEAHIYLGPEQVEKLLSGLVHQHQKITLEA